MGDASDIIEYDRRASGLSNAALHMQEDANGIEKNTIFLNLRLRLTLASAVYWDTFLAASDSFLAVPSCASLLTMAVCVWPREYM